MDRYDFITLDTQVLEQNGYHFDKGLLAQLKQFEDGPIKILLSEIILLEIAKKLHERTKKARDEIESARKEAIEYEIHTDESPVISEKIPDSKEISRKRISKFMKEIGAEFVKIDNVSTRDVMKRYFSALPPFSSQKKHEFPDAIALLSLEDWAKQSGKKILAVSKDKDWVEYGKISERITVIEDLAKALETVQEHANTTEAAIQNILNNLVDGHAPSLLEYFEESLGRLISEHSMRAETESSLTVSNDDLELSMSGYQLLKKGDNKYSVTIVRIGSESVTAQIDIDVSVTASAYFSFSFTDDEDDEIGMGSSHEKQEHSFEISLLIEFIGDLDKTTEIGEMEISYAPDSLYFGYVEPDYSEDNSGEDFDAEIEYYESDDSSAT